jgi:GT2 family glycosyltransferase
MIYHNSPQRSDKNIGRAYNDFMELLKPEDYAAFTDLDTCFLTREQPNFIEQAISEYPDTGMFVCYTNRLGNQDQLLNIKDYNTDIAYHVRIAKEQQELPFSVRPLKGLPGGMLMVIKKATWEKVGRFVDGFLGVDNNYGFRLLHNGYKILLIENLYIFHLRDLK